MKIGEFGKALKLWRGARLQKEAADVLEVNLRTYEGWESGRQPSRYAINEIKRRMAEHPA
jgi:DNA-binding XRE family transcriptional regulator